MPAGAGRKSVEEIAAAYRVRPPLVVDCSVLSAFLFEEPMRDEALRHMLGKPLHAPTLLDHGFANVTTRKLRQAWPAESIEMALADYAPHEIGLHRVEVAERVALANHYGLSADDAAYRRLAAELKPPLATFDVKLGRAALQHPGNLG